MTQAKQSPRTPEELRNAIKQCEHKLASVEKNSTAYHATKLMLMRLRTQYEPLVRDSSRKYVGHRYA